MKRVAIIEDEPLTAERMQNLLNDFSGLEVVETLYSVTEAIDWFHQADSIDLVFMDIELGDGTAFDILNRVASLPFIVFTTAYDQYTLEAFRHNSVDYLLKPVKAEDLDRAVRKYEQLTEPREAFIQQLNDLQSFLDKKHKKKFLVKRGGQLKSVPVEQICYFLSEEGLTYLVESNGKRWLLDLALDEVEVQLNPESFHRINRKSIVCWSGIDSIETYYNGRLLVQPVIPPSEPLIVSRDRVKGFKAWLDR